MLVINFIRSSIFNIFYVLWTTLLCTTYRIFFLFNPKCIENVGYIWAKFMLLFLKYFMGITYKIEGKENIPPEGSRAIIASKHQSALDIFLVMYIFKFPAYILKKELLKIPLFGWFLVNMGMIPIDRSAGASALKQIIKDTKIRLEQNRKIIIYPEGTRTKPGTKLPYQPGVGALYKFMNDTDLIPVALNSGIVWPRNSFIKKPGLVTIKFLPPIAKNLSSDEFMKQLENIIETESNQLLAGAHCR